MRFKGLWNICEVKVINGDYFNLEVESFVRIHDGGKGEFKFGLNTGDLTGKVVYQGSTEKFIFKWLGMDKLKILNGSAWIEIVEEDFIEGEVTSYDGNQWRIKAKKNKFV
ncbi:hypothetical protein ACJDU8_02760 [Clostridium sp. WILCCON 0269]|uniref:Uncharacterized protein n=1 Tax=Candidatus Clostridium eludens TaxID=3381663 RepID=A0ABW8SGZ9_9CLOT